MEVYKDFTEWCPAVPNITRQQYIKIKTTAEIIDMSMFKTCKQFDSLNHVVSFDS